MINDSVDVSVDAVVYIDNDSVEVKVLAKFVRIVTSVSSVVMGFSVDADIVNQRDSVNIVEAESVAVDVCILESDTEGVDVVTVTSNLSVLVELSYAFSKAPTKWCKALPTTSFVTMFPVVNSSREDLVVVGLINDSVDVSVDAVVYIDNDSVEVEELVKFVSESFDSDFSVGVRIDTSVASVVNGSSVDADIVNQRDSVTVVEAESVAVGVCILESDTEGVDVVTVSSNSSVVVELSYTFSKAPTK